MDEPLIMEPLYRSLAERTYFVKFGFIRLTETDMGVALAVLGLGYVLVGATGLGSIKLYFNFLTLDPWFGVFCFLATVIFISILNHKRPDGNATDYLRWLLMRKKGYAVNAREGNPFWRSGFRPYLFRQGKRRGSKRGLWWAAG